MLFGVEEPFIAKKLGSREKNDQAKGVDCVVAKENTTTTTFAQQNMGGLPVIKKWRLCSNREVLDRFAEFMANPVNMQFSPKYACVVQGIYRGSDFAVTVSSIEKVGGLSVFYVRNYLGLGDETDDDARIPYLYRLTSKTGRHYYLKTDDILRISVVK